MTRQFNRNYVLTVTNLKTKTQVDITNLKLAFSLSRNTDSMSSKAKVQVYNLAPKTREFLTVVNNKDSTPNLEVELKCGYGLDTNNLKTIIKGKAIGFHEWRPPESISTFQVSDGLFEQALAKVNNSYKKGKPYKDIIKDLMNAIGLPIGKSDVEEIQGSLPKARVFNASPKKSLDELGELLGFRYIVENSFQSIRLKSKDNAPAESVKAFLLDLNTGLIGQPFQRGDFIIAKCLFNPNIRINDYVTVKSSTLQSEGTYRVIEVKGKGDTFSQAWEMELTLSLQDTLLLLNDIKDIIDTGVTYA